MSKCWFQLVDADGNSLMQETYVQMDRGAVVADFQKQVHSAYAKKLPANVVDTDLRVYGSQVAFENRKTVTPMSARDSLAMEPNNVLWVQVNPPDQRIASAASLKVFIESKLSSYRGNFMRLKSDPYAVMQSNGSQVPLIDARPALLLHQLSESAEHAWTDWEYFYKNRKRILFGVSGSGKTRLTFEMLAQHWGLYFTCVPGEEKYHDFGSRDFTTASDFVRRCIPLEAAKSPGELSDRFTLALDHLKLLYACRFITMQYVQHEFEYTPLDWLHLQTLGLPVFEEHEQEYRFKDIFDEIYKYAKKSFDSVGDITFLTDAEFAVIDEAQAGLKTMEKTFPQSSHFKTADLNMKGERSLLTVAVYAFSQVAEGSRVIITGTGLRMSSAIEQMKSSIGVGLEKTPRPLFVLQGYESPAAFQAFVNRFFVLDLASENPIRLAFEFLRGRARFTSVFIKSLLENRLQSRRTGALAPDEIHVALEEAIGNLVTFSLDSRKNLATCITEFMQKLSVGAPKTLPTMLSFPQVALSYYLEQHRKNLPATELDLQIIELGIGRICPAEANEVIVSVDEPLVYLAAYQIYNPLKYLLNELKDTEKPSIQGFQFEDVISEFMKTTWLKNGTCLRCMFDLFPDQSDQRALSRLPDWLRDGQIALYATSYLLNLRERAGINLFISNAFAKRNTTAFFMPPDMHRVDRFAVMKIGDNHFVSLSLQIKFLSTDLTPAEYQKARQTVNAKRLYDVLGVSAEKYGRFAAHIGIIIVYGARADTQSPRQVQVSWSGGDKEKPIVYLTFDSRNPEFFAPIIDDLNDAQKNAKTPEVIAQYFAGVHTRPVTSVQHASLDDGIDTDYPMVED